MKPDANGSNNGLSSLEPGEYPNVIDWDDAFDNSGHVAGSELLAGRWSAAAACARAELESHARARIDLPYGPLPRNRLDLFEPDSNCAGLIVFIHGGYWHKLDKSYWSHLARGPLAAGWAMAIPSYTLAPETRISAITREVSAAIGFAAERIVGPIRLVGHSAGGHLVTRMVCDDSPLDAEVLERVQKVVPVSGVFDLRPLTLTRMNDVLRLDDDEATAESPVLRSPLKEMEVCFWVGAGERPEFLRQNRCICETWQRHNGKVSDRYETGKHHFSVVEGIASPQSALTRELIA